MPAEKSPVVIAYDGSERSRVALRRAAELFPDRVAVVATVWEPALAQMAWGGSSDLLGADAPLPLDPETARTLDDTAAEHAARVANEGAELALSLGLAAERRAVGDAADIADTLITLARERGVAAIVVGSHGMGLRSIVLGSVARKMVSHGDIPVVVVRSE
jgi:nucleotide-binding universal stress UspA family protein